MEMIDEELFLELASNVFELMLEIPVQSAVPCDTPASPTDYLSQISMSGTTNLEVAVRAPEQTAIQIASTMFKESPDALTEEDVRDAVGEITNMVGGNLKGLGDGDSKLTLPNVSRVGDDASETPPSQVTVLLEGQPLHFAWK
ncbi:MAG: chemotaxis protein CheX [Fuerstiella sp.]